MLHRLFHGKHQEKQVSVNDPFAPIEADEAALSTEQTQLESDTAAAEAAYAAGAVPGSLDPTDVANIASQIDTINTAIASIQASLANVATATAPSVATAPAVDAAPAAPVEEAFKQSDPSVVPQ